MQPHNSFDTDIESLIQRDAEVILHPASSITALLENGPQMIVDAKGSYIIDANGNRLLDAVGGLWCVNVGYGRAELAEVMQQTAKQLGYYHTFANASNPWQVQLADKLLKYAPDNLGKVFFGNGGSDANDTLVKIAWHYHALRGHHSKTKVIARQQAYHGTSISTASLTGLGGFHREFPLPLDFVLRVECPHYYTRGLAGETESEFCDRLIQEVADLIESEGADNIAAFFAEPIHAAGGIIEPPQDYYPKLKALLSSHDILLVADEVVCGFGRTGSWFGSEQLGFEPDMMSTAKGLTSGYFPMSAALISDQIWSVLKEGSAKLGAFSHGYTYSGHPIGCAVALVNLQIMENEKLVDQARDNGAYMHRRLTETLGDHAHVGEIRGRGLLAGVQLVQDRATGQLPDITWKWPLQVTNYCRDKGVIVRPLPSVGTIAISPPLTISRSEIDQLVEALSDAVNTLNM
ncbi:MAG: aspartate aminotransferase family protein [Candidatus Pelagadaptatus aseana]|uniref:aminotransferase family protein n=1 Tax=Candidatus Pelagadaptatus aseana TaxID=3120508 RepID=UPI0039B1F9C6